MSYKTREELLEEMLAVIRKNPGIRPSLLNRLLNIPHTWNLRKELLKKGLVRKEKRGLAVYYYPLSPKAGRYPLIQKLPPARTTIKTRAITTA